MEKRSSVSRSEGRKDKQGSPQQTALRATEMFKRVVGVVCLYSDPLGCIIITVCWNPWEKMWYFKGKYFLVVSLERPPSLFLEDAVPQPSESLLLSGLLAPRARGDIYTGSSGKRNRNSVLGGFYSACHIYCSSLEKDFGKDKEEVNLFLLWGGCLDCERLPWLSSEGTFQTARQRNCRAQTVAFRGYAQQSLSICLSHGCSAFGEGFGPLMMKRHQASLPAAFDNCLSVG